MSVLLDTHLLLWSAFQPARLPPRAREVIEGGERALWFSAASIWEVAIKRGLDRPDFRVDLDLLGESGEHQVRNPKVFYGKREQTDAGVSG